MISLIKYLIGRNQLSGLKLHHETHGLLNAKYEVKEIFTSSFTGKSINAFYTVFYNAKTGIYISTKPHVLDEDKHKLYDHKDILDHSKLFSLGAPSRSDAETAAEASLQNNILNEIDRFDGHIRLLNELNEEIDAYKKISESSLTLIIDSNFKFEYFIIGFSLLLGKAGVGKSFLINSLCDDKSDASIVKLSPTAIAAININGQTIHSFFRFPPNIFDPSNSEYIKKDKRFSSFDYLIIDEISMVPGYLIDAIDKVLRLNNDPRKIFGGKVILAFGDLLQLEPVPARDPDAQKFIEQNYNGSYWFFDAKVFEDNPPDDSIFGKIYPSIIGHSKRHTDDKFIQFLDMFRKGKVEDQELFDEIAAIICSNQQSHHTTHLVTTNQFANEINLSQLKEIQAPNLLYESRINGTWEDSHPNDNQINLKKGAEIIFIKNDNNKNYFNGEKGVIESLNENSVVIKTKNNESIIVEYATWEKIKYVFNKETNKLDTEVIGTFSQLPIKLGWAITIHRSQGMTLDHITINFNTKFFAKGMLYVALSRVRKPSDIYVSDGKLTKSLVSSPEQRVIDFLKYFQILNS